MKQKYDGSIKPYIGCKVADFNEFGYLNVQGGPTISWWEYLFTSDEMGTLHQNKQDDTKVGTAFGVEYNNHFDYGNLGSWFGGPNVYGGIQLSDWTEYVQGFALSPSTGSVSGSTYIPSVEGAWINTFYAGWGMYF